MHHHVVLFYAPLCGWKRFTLNIFFDILKVEYMTYASMNYYELFRILIWFKWWLQMEFFLQFQKTHPSIVIGKQAFDGLHPFWVKKMKECNVWCCIYHVELEELWMGFNHMCQKSRLHSNFHCDREVVLWKYWWP